MNTWRETKDGKENVLLRENWKEGKDKLILR